MEYRSVIGGGLVVCGVLLGTLQALQYVRFPETAAVVLLNTVPFIFVAAAIVYTGVTIAIREEYDEYATLIVSWAVGGAVGFVAVFTLLTGTSTQDGLTLLLGAVDAGSAGMLAGLLVGLYDTQNRQTLATVEQFAQKLETLNNYGKVLNQSTGIESVSALCIEVVEFVLDGSGATFVIAENDEAYIVDTTLPDIDTGDLERAKRELHETEALNTVIDGAGFDKIRNEQPGETIAIRIPAGDATAVLVAVYYDIDDVDETNIDLFEILAAHVSTALSTVDTQRLQTEFMESI
ncbi:hypothetical protein halTADL_1036 [Halohasta litchfieldiae]|jgi:hypothetical protein|uniref:Archaeal histidine kinase 4TM domain-containing protein n=1 Tax=Halohasta litchfieldiae TaxID=1073996 RepID=A0A1H6SGS9_9EURY|nr:hypothetical protein [Halohasta litchfieldiae]ATW87830.1 hypothetical protein halTADL_1036 [Halohasta litchfieldiae]SEI64037.1 hypothetical protein SAMN05444271_104162 [Halohasta litchfieldiae]